MAQVSYGTITITDTTDIERIYPIYCKGDLTNAPSISGATNWNKWKELISQAGGSGDYIWQRIVTKKVGVEITYSNASQYCSDAVRLTGEAGISPNPLTITSTQYAQTANENDTPSYGNTMPSSITEGYWLWVKVNYSDGNSVITKIKQGQKGEQGYSVVSTRELYYLKTNSSDVTQITSSSQITNTNRQNGWTSIVPDYVENGIYYTCIETTLDSPTNNLKWSAPVENKGLTSANQKALDAYNTSTARDTEVNALKAQAKHYWWDSQGAHVAAGENTTSVDNITQGTPSTYGFNSLMAPGYLALKYKNIDFAQLATNSLTFYRPATDGSTYVQGKKGMDLTADALTFYKPLAYNSSNEPTAAATLNANGLILSEGGVQAGTAGQSGFIYLSTKNYGSNLTINNHQASNWREVIGTKFGVDADGNLYASNAEIGGKITASSLTIGSGATVSGLSTSDISGMNDYALQESLDAEVTQRKAVYAVSTTQATAPAKTTESGTPSGFVLYNGATVTVKFNSANSTTTPTLNVNNTGAKTIKSYTGAALTVAEYTWPAGAAITFTYDGTYWRMQDGGALQAKADAAASASSASSSASAASSSASSASTSASNASSSATSASNSASSASSSATTATNKANAASESATNAASSATAASGSATAASNSATAASNSATAASNSATAASNSATAAAEVMGGFTILWNYSAFGTSTAGDAFICGFDPATGTKSDANGWVKWNSTKRTITKQQVNPGTIVPYNIPIYIVCRLSSATGTTGTNYMVWYNAGWKYAACPSPTAVGGSWTWTDNRDIILGSFVETGTNEVLTECELFNPPWTSKQITTNTTTPTSYIMDTDSNKGITVKPKDSSGNDFLQMNSTAIEFFRNSTTASVMRLTDSSFRLGLEASNHTTIDTNGLHIWAGTESTATNEVALFSATARIGKTNSSRFIIDTAKLQAYNSSNQLYYEVSSSGIKFGSNLGSTVATTTYADEKADAAQTAAEATAAGYTDTKTSNLATQDALNTEINQRKATYGTSSTGASTRAKVVTCADFELIAGNEITVKFSTANTYISNSVQLNVNGKGAKDIWVANAVTSSTNQLLWGANAYITFKYDGTQFIVIGEPRTWYGASTTPAATAAKTDTTAVTGCVICKGAKIELAMSNNNTNTSATLNIQSTGAKNIYYGNTTTRPTVENGHSWLGTSTATFTFDGAYYRMAGQTVISGDSITTGTISANRLNISDIISNGSIAVTNQIPTDLSDLNNDTGYITSASVPTKVSQLTNDSDFQDATQVNNTITSKGYQTASDVNGAINTATSELATKGDAVYRTQRIYYRKTSNGAPGSNTTWLTSSTSGTGYGNWSLSIPQLTSGTTKYPYLYTAIQTQTITQYNGGSGTTCSCSAVLLDNTTTIIDGGAIIAGSVTANEITGSKLSAIYADMGSITAGNITKGYNSINFDNSPATLEFKNASTWSTATQGIKYDADGLAIKGAITANTLIVEDGAEVSGVPVTKDLLDVAQDAMGVTVYQYSNNGIIEDVYKTQDGIYYYINIQQDGTEEHVVVDADDLMKDGEDLVTIEKGGLAEEIRNLTQDLNTFIDEDNPAILEALKGEINSSITDNSLIAREYCVIENNSINIYGQNSNYQNVSSLTLTSNSVSLRAQGIEAASMNNDNGEGVLKADTSIQSTIRMRSVGENSKGIFDWIAQSDGHLSLKVVGTYGNN